LRRPAPIEEIMGMKLLLVSTSTTFGTGYLDHCAGEMDDLLGEVRQVLFVPYALYDRNMYAAKARERFEQIGCRLDSVHESADPVRAVEDAQAIFIGGGNTFRLMNELYRMSLVDPIRRRVREGAPYMGTSAGSNVACVTIKTTNDMPIVQPPSFEALDLVPFNINPHYIDPDPGSMHMGETRETRIREFLEENDKIVVGLREGAMLRVDRSSVVLKGERGARVFRRDREPEEYSPGANMDFLLA
jgi:dipeptidase E